MRIGLIDVDGHNWPNLPLMKLSAWHKQQGHTVEWYNHLFHGWPNKPFDMVYMSKVFDFTPDYEYQPNANEVIRGGTAIDIKSKLPAEVENIYPDYTIYPTYTKNTAYGFLTRGCPRNCDFCIVTQKEGCVSHKVADLKHFWRDQRNIKLLDPNLLACKDYSALLGQLIDSGAYIDFTQGLDIRLMTTEKIDLIKQLKIKMMHFAWDNYSDKALILDKLKEFKELTGYGQRELSVYVLVNYNSTFEEDLERIYIIRDLGYWPFVMVYDKQKLPPRHKLKQLQRWVNMRAVFQTVKTFEEYLGGRDYE